MRMRIRGCGPQMRSKLFFFYALLHGFSFFNGLGEPKGLLDVGKHPFFRGCVAQFGEATKNVFHFLNTLFTFVHFVFFEHVAQFYFDLNFICSTHILISILYVQHISGLCLLKPLSLDWYHRVHCLNGFHLCVSKTQNKY